MKSHNQRDISWPLFLFILTLLTRIPFTSKYLYHMDSVQFALALENYDITVHQPHPPGYFLYVMLGRVINHFIQDANTVFISISVFFSGLAVVSIYLLGKEIFDKKTGIFAALIALTSPNLWFHGEVALTYVVEAFFSSLIALLCWRILKGKHKYLWLSVIALGIAGGIRQNTVVFLLPLWFFSVKAVPLRKILMSLCLLGVVCLLWFFPMVCMTGGWTAYQDAFRELWLFNTGNVSVFEKGLPLLKLFASTYFDSVSLGIGAGIFSLGLAAYTIVKYKFKKEKSPDKMKFSFFSFWILPPSLFFLLIFIHPANPGYVLVFIPALLVLSGASVCCVNNELKKIINKDVSVLIVVIMLIINTALFFLTNYFVSQHEIKTHDNNVSIMLDRMKHYNPATTEIFVPPYTFYGYRQIMYYLPEYRVYQVDIRFLPTGEIRKIFFGKNRKTFLTDQIVIPEQINNFIMPMFLSDMKKVLSVKGLAFHKLLPDFFVIQGSIELIKEIYPELDIHITTANG